MRGNGDVPEVCDTVMDSEVMVSSSVVSISFEVSSLRVSVRGNVEVPEVCDMLMDSEILVKLLLTEGNLIRVVLTNGCVHMEERGREESCLPCWWVGHLGFRVRFTGFKIIRGRY